MVHVVWGWLTALDLFLIGTAGGAAITSGAVHILGKDKYNALAEAGAYLAPLLGLASLLTVMLDLGRLPVAPMNVLYVINHLPESMISLGTVFRVAFIAVATLNAILWFFRKETLVNLVVRIICGAVNMVLGFLVTIYPGIMLSFAMGKPFWSSPVFPWVISVSGILSGLVLSALSIPIIGVLVPRLTPALLEARRTVLIHKIPEKVGSCMSALIIIELVLVFVYLNSVSGTVGATVVFTNPMVSMFFWGGFIFLGLILPLIIFVLEKLRLGLPLSVWIFILYICFILVAVCAVAARYSLLVAGQIL
ncbi:hypothetical protein DRO26_03445 [Candidatus Bathyarchaeota archaeon]|nr:MAG: hypothetical protein DRO26_03445 [Candidatus Bathyarchaeota archaeon]